jgi:thymidine kinase
MSTTIYFKYGAMSSGKSLELIKISHNYQERGISPLILKPEIDTRKPGYIYSKSGLHLPAIEITCDDVNKIAEVFKQKHADHSVILVEESNFLSPEIVDFIVNYAYDHDISSVFFFGLMTDFRSNLFPGTKRILELADKIEESTSICWCGKKARKNARLINGEITKEGPTILVDDANSVVEYTTLCNYHYHIGQLK